MERNRRYPFPKGIRHLGIFAPAGRVDKDIVFECVESLEELGLEVTLAPNLFRGSRLNYLSAPLEARVEDLNTFLADESIDVLLAARGGYGCAQLLSHIDWDTMVRRHLPILGYSDITALHLAMLSRSAGVPIASPMASQLPEALLDKEFFSQSLNSALTCGAFEPLLPKPFRVKLIKPGIACAPLIPANLTVLCSLIGTEFFPDLSGTVLLLEDIREPLYKLDRCLNQLSQAGVLSKLSGLLFGDFRRCGNSRSRRSLFEEYSKVIDGPVLTGIPFGHRLPILCLRCGGNVSIGESGSMKLY